MPRTAAQSSAQRWEYLERTTTVHRECRAFDDRDTGAPTQAFMQHRVLATLGLEGWELVTVGSGGTEPGWIFKRPTRQ